MKTASGINGVIRIAQVELNIARDPGNHLKTRL